jgi:L-rhamnose mutarotase
MAVLEVNERWQKEMKPFFVELEGRPDQAMMRLPEVFHLP